MEGRVEQLRERLRALLKETAEVSAENPNLDGTQAEVPHDSQIENVAHATRERTFPDDSAVAGSGSRLGQGFARWLSDLRRGVPSSKVLQLD